MGYVKKDVYSSISATDSYRNFVASNGPFSSRRSHTFVSMCSAILCINTFIRQISEAHFARNDVPHSASDFTVMSDLQGVPDFTVKSDRATCFSVCC